MPRATNNPASKQRRKKILNRAKGFFGRGKSTIRAATRLTERADRYAGVHRRLFRRDIRSLWIMRINAAVREHGLSYSQFMNLAKQKNLGLDRKALAEIAYSDPEGFASIVKQVQA